MSGKNNITSAWDNMSFCTCVDNTCPNNPANCALGCTPCVEKCLSENEIPVCFFRKQQPDMAREQDYSFEGFRQFYIKKQQGEALTFDMRESAAGGG